MDYKEKYEQLTKFIRDLHPFMTAYCKEKTEAFFSSLKESEDERIKRCIRMCLTDVSEQRFEDFNATLKDCLSWLEKQGEQKSTKWTEKDERLLSKLQTYVDMESFDRECNGEELIAWLKSLKERTNSDKKAEIAEQFARIIRGHLTQIDKEVQLEFENLYTEITGRKMYGGYID